MQEVKEEPIQDTDVRREVMKVQTDERNLEKLGPTYLQETRQYRESTQHMNEDWFSTSNFQDAMKASPESLWLDLIVHLLWLTGETMTMIITLIVMKSMVVWKGTWNKFRTTAWSFRMYLQRNFFLQLIKHPENRRVKNDVLA